MYTWIDLSVLFYKQRFKTTFEKQRTRALQSQRTRYYDMDWSSPGYVAKINIPWPCDRDRDWYGLLPWHGLIFAQNFQRVNTKRFWYALIFAWYGFMIWIDRCFVINICIYIPWLWYIQACMCASAAKFSTVNSTSPWKAPWNNLSHSLT
jgi:hypothetical protein